MPQYQIWFNQAQTHIFEIELMITTPKSPQRLSLPAWIPGSYMIREFSKNIVEINACDDGGDCPISKVDKHTWSVQSKNGPLRIRYTVYAWDLSVRMAHFDQTHAYFNGTSVFLCAHGHEEAPHEVQLHRPKGQEYAKWRIATTLKPKHEDPTEFGTFSATNYDDLIDHPVEIADYTRIEFEACGVPHEMVITGIHRADTERLGRDLKTICEAQIQFFGTPAPMERYVFMTMALGGYGGLEHRSSTSLLCSRNDLPQRHETHTVSEKYKTFLGLCSHEYFHTWNVKRIRPAVFTPYDLSQEGYTTLLWAFEGITSYYDDLFLRRTGLIDTKTYLGLVAKNATRILKGNGRTKQSLADSSFYAWTKFYRQDENAPNAIVSYYGKGALVALALDLYLRRETDGACSLDCVMRKLWKEHGQPNIGVPENGIERIAEACSGVDLSYFFEQYVHGTNDPPLQSLLQDFGVKWTISQTEKPVEGDWQAGDLGVRTGTSAGGVKLLNVYDNGAAQACGLSAGDIVIAIDGIKTEAKTFATLIASYPIGAELTIHAFRRDVLMTFTAKLQAKSSHFVHLEAIDSSEIEETVRLRRQSWLTPNGGR